uniref:Uncharacterized protein n=1 Tax=Candidatus Kentrum sp. MB TaxID=2138164 RepID=A0A450X465_9GAMM|nr:MAG: hypothetical protein BECKMB1821G_GA0114241_100716 [Candidatus Kentron sp. MB]VFK34103.1 MAG: hypothetical protein BECKMB1821I_GA0114274_10615 [Candidatus Kentron sp. MB]VFK76740.1 MAG: hypothetical protein BECKMB1821H_GA0114242_10725 [Candidatus Kentron sp. MB]
MSKLYSSPRRLAVSILVLAWLFASGCTQIGPDMVKGGRNDYNQVLAKTGDEETLLNLVRLRYADNPVFLEVASISTSFTWNQGLDAKITEVQPQGAGDQIELGGSLGYSERPTITYTPLGGANFVRNVLTPVELDSLLLLSHSGWSIERLLRVMANRMNGVENAREASGPTPANAPRFADFLTATEIMRTLQRKSAITFGYRKEGKETVPAMRIEPDALDSDQLQALSDIIGLQPDKPFVDLDIAAHQPRPDALGFELRSLAGIMFFLSHAVDVPEQDITEGRATVTKTASGAPFDWELVVGDLLDIKSQEEQPSNAAIAIRYRNSWFYIDDADTQSKYTLMLLGQLRALQAGNIHRIGPLLTLPVSR